MNTFVIEKLDEEIVIRDAAARPRRRRAVYDRISPASIPGIRVEEQAGESSERFTIRIPRDVFQHMPAFRNCPSDDGKNKATRGRTATDVLEHSSAPNNRIELPGTMWHLLTVLKIGQEDNFDGDALFLDKMDVQDLAGTIQVCSDRTTILTAYPCHTSRDSA